MRRNSIVPLVIADLAVLAVCGQMIAAIVWAVIQHRGFLAVTLIFATVPFAAVAIWLSEYIWAVFRRRMRLHGGRGGRGFTVQAAPPRSR